MELKLDLEQFIGVGGGTFVFYLFTSLLMDFLK